MASIQNVVTQQVLQATSIIEKQLDAEIEKLEKLDEDGLERLREERLSKMKAEAQMKKEWLQLGHGSYEELPEESDFFGVMKKSKNVVVHFFRCDAGRCKIFDHHLKILAAKHIETRFVKLDAERCPFLAERLKIKVIPLLLLAIDGKVRDRIIGFTDLGNRDDFSTSMLEWRLAQSAVINYDGDILNPPDDKMPQKKTRRTIRDSSNRESDSEDSS